MRAFAVGLGIASLLGCFAVGCGSSDGSAAPPANADDTGAPPVAASPGAPSAGGMNGAAAATTTPVTLSGDYELSSFYDLTTSGLFPDAANGTLKALSDLKDNPAQAIVGILQANNVPIVATVLGYIPDVLKDDFEGYINDTVFKSLYQNVPAAQNIASLITDLASVTTNFELVSALHLPPGGDTGSVVGSHSLSGVAFTIGGKRSVIDTPSLLNDLTRASHVDASCLHIVEHSAAVENGRLELGDHGFGVPLGDYAANAIDGVPQATLGASSLRDALGKAIDCQGVGDSVAAECVGPVCIGHSSDIVDMCNAGLDAIAAEVTAGLTALNLKVVHMKSGDAQMWDAPVAGGALDGKIDRIDHGTWQAFLDVGTGEHPVAATFQGHRTGDAQTK